MSDYFELDFISDSFVRSLIKDHHKNRGPMLKKLLVDTSPFISGLPDDRNQGQPPPQKQKAHLHWSCAQGSESSSAACEGLPQLGSMLDQQCLALLGGVDDS